MALTPDQEKLKEAALAVQSKKEPGGQFYQQDFANLANPAAILAILAQLEQVQGDAHALSVQLQGQDFPPPPEAA